MLAATKGTVKDIERAVLKVVWRATSKVVD